MVWEMNLRLLLDQDLQGHILLVEAAEVTQVSDSDAESRRYRYLRAYAKK